MVKKTQLFYLFYISCSYISSLWGGGYILPNLTKSQEPEQHVFVPLEPEPLEKKIPGAGDAWE